MARVEQSKPIPKFMQFSGHNEQMFNLWRFWNYEWPVSPYAPNTGAVTTFELQIDSQCIAQSLLSLEASVRSCIAMNIRSDNYHMELNIGKPGEPLPYDLFREFMDSLSFRQLGFDIAVASENCAGDRPPGYVGP